MVLGGRACEVPQELRGLCKEVLKIYNGPVTVLDAVAERLRVSREEVEAMDLKEDQ